MSIRETVHTLIDTLSDEQLQAFITLFGNSINIIPEVEPDEWDKEMLQRAKNENDGKTISIEDLVAETRIDYDSL